MINKSQVIRISDRIKAHTRTHHLYAPTPIHYTYLYTYTPAVVIACHGRHWATELSLCMPFVPPNALYPHAAANALTVSTSLIGLEATEEQTQFLKTLSSEGNQNHRWFWSAWVFFKLKCCPVKYGLVCAVHIVILLFAYSFRTYKQRIWI